ncbi:MurR/RpiR family transcriptional regulator [Hoeflea alexandrii]|uniref:SIS domain-containing protein n=1 Tax=Hoeflea alexandrii TaxID=288436 RepID=A0ABT1CK01_9HYPH|nr:MurR/RpiR family transcriptional regulator [Hoeflea alexandrii]MCO6406547.1 SIS domain-containing protein [Hoeflea alexandrii]MCY0154956.1 MurR/RpiR family transcriptional regulator [Hoeflea alexandrii]
MIKKSEPQPSQSGETFDALRQRIRDRFPTLSPHLQRIARASLEEANAFALNTTPVIAAELGIQPSTLIRFAKELGYAGFSDLQRVFRQRLIEGQVNVRNEVLARDEAAARPDTRATLDACLKAHGEAIERLARECDTEALNRAIQMMQQAGHVYVAGLRRSRPIAEYFHYGMIRGERACSSLDFAGGMAGPQIATMKADDVLFAIAFPPYSQPVVDVVLDAHVSGRRIVAITDSAESPLATYAEVALLLGADTAAQLQPISAAIALVQTLVMGITRP